MSGGFIGYTLYKPLVFRVLGIVPMCDPQVSVQVAGVFKWFVAPCSSVAARHWTIERPYTVGIARAVPPVVFLTFGLGEVRFVASRTFLISLLQNLMISKMVL